MLHCPPDEEVVAPSRGHGRCKGVPVGVPTKHDAAVCGRRNVRAMERVCVCVCVCEYVSMCA